MKKRKGLKLDDGRIITRENTRAFMLNEARKQIRSMGLNPDDFDINITGVEPRETEGCVRVKWSIMPKDKAQFTDLAS